MQDFLDSIKDQFRKFSNHDLKKILSQICKKSLKKSAKKIEIIDEICNQITNGGKAFCKIFLEGFAEFNLPFDGFRITDIPLEGIRLRECSLKKVKICSVNLCGSTLSKSNLYKAVLIDVNLKQVDLIAAKLQCTNLKDCLNLNQATLSFAIYDNDTTWPEGFNYTISGAIGPKAQLSGKDLSGLDLTGVANLSDATFNATILSKAELYDTILHNVDLRNSIIKPTQLCSSQLSNSQFIVQNFVNPETGQNFSNIIDFGKSIQNPNKNYFIHWCEKWNLQPYLFDMEIVEVERYDDNYKHKTITMLIKFQAFDFKFYGFEIKETYRWGGLVESIIQADFFEVFMSFNQLIQHIQNLKKYQLDAWKILSYEMYNASTHPIPAAKIQHIHNLIRKLPNINHPGLQKR